jgi:hypothetical protein
MKTRMRKIGIFVILFLCCEGTAYAQDPLSDAAFSQSFRCPESLPTDQARMDEALRFLFWAKQRHPDLTVSKIAELRVKFLEEHHCDKALKNLSAPSALEKNNSTRNLCIANDGSRYFSAEPASHCTPVPLDRGWVNFHSEANILMDIMPAKIVKERDGTKIWAQFFIAQPVPSDDGKWSYDYVKSITKFFCGKKQQLLIQGTYSLNGRRVYERSSAESIVEEIEPGTLAEDVYRYACK